VTQGSPVTQSAVDATEGIPLGRDTQQEGWLPEGEMARMLDLCEAQMDAAMRDSDQAVDALVKVFTELVVMARNVSEISKGLSVTGKHQSLAKDLEHRSAAITQQIGQAIVAFQFYDKLTQRMGHVRYSLSTLALFICNETRSSPEHWNKLLNTLKRLYRTEEERAIFDAITEGKPLPPSPQEKPQGSVQPEAAGHIELF
jgi:hypothetical protein